MKNMIRASFYKLFHDGVTWISLAGTVIWSLFIGMMVRWIGDAGTGSQELIAAEKYWNDFIGYHAVMIPLLVSSIVLFTTEFKDKSWKLLVARGISKTAFYFSKLLCILTLTVMLSIVAVITGAIFGVAALGMQFDAAFAGRVLWFCIWQTVTHCTAAVLLLTVYFLIKVSEVSSAVNMLLLMFGTRALSKIENAASLGDALTGSWAFAQPLRVSFTGESDHLRILIVFAAYLIICSLAAVLFGVRGDVE